ncbi:MAG TPA: DUF294 nucleotidyltransferase-like domain-containing protein [Caulobacteraceae bacterium]|nr:DUF294 nucleotidyltransferase-like domain-containing protein [Caulobacteraceae bacterium]
MVRRWRGRLECVFQAPEPTDACLAALSARADEARQRHRLQSKALESLIGEGALDMAEAARQLTAEGDLNLRTMLAIAAEQVAHEHGAAPGRCAVFGLGKFGGAEMTLGSDLDLLFVYDPSNDDLAVNAADYFGRMAQKLTQLLVEAPDWRMAYEVDFRLRPHGEDGPLATSLSGLKHYLSTEAWVWELQALTRLRAIAGCERLARETAEAALDAMQRRCRAIDPCAEVGAMRALLEIERPARCDWDLKLRPGGLVDIEFIVQALQLVSAKNGRPMMVANTGQALIELERAGYLSKDKARRLVGAWRLISSFRQLQSAMGVSDLSRLKGAEKAALEAMTGLSPGMARTRLLAACDRVRGLFEALVGPVEVEQAA